MAFSGAFEAYSTSLVISTAWRKKIGRDLRDVVDRAGAAAQIAAVHVGEAGFASGTNLQRQAHVARADAFDVAALLDHGEQDVVALVEQRKFVADLFELQRDGLRILHLCHGGVSVVGFELAQAGLPVPRWLLVAKLWIQ